MDAAKLAAMSGLVSSPAYNIMNGLPPNMPADAYGNPDWDALSLIQAHRLDRLRQTYSPVTTVGRFQRGTDSVPSMLTPGEAVLNRNAAKLLGRDKIRDLNAKGNNMQSYEDGTDYVVDASQRRGTRTGKSYFPAANTALRNRPNMNDYSWITTPSGGSMRVPTKSLGALLDTGSLKGSQVTQIGNQAPIDRNAAYARGYGAPNPTIQGGYQTTGGVANPIENLTPQARIAGGVGGTLDYFRSNPALTAATNALSGFGNSIARFFTPPQPNQVREVNQPTNFGVGANFSQPPPNPFAGNINFQLPPRRYSDLGYY